MSVGRPCSHVCADEYKLPLGTVALRLHPGPGANECATVRGVIEHPVSRLRVARCGRPAGVVRGALTIRNGLFTVTYASVLEADGDASMDHKVVQCDNLPHHDDHAAGSIQHVLDAHYIRSVEVGANGHPGLAEYAQISGAVRLGEKIERGSRVPEPARRPEEYTDLNLQFIIIKWLVHLNGTVHLCQPA